MRRHNLLSDVKIDNITGVTNYIDFQKKFGYDITDDEVIKKHPKFFNKFKYKLIPVKLSFLLFGKKFLKYSMN